MYKIPFNKPFLTGKEIQYIQESVESGQISGNGIFTKKCHKFFEDRYGFNKCYLTTSCTDALEMTAILMDIKAGDEVIIPSFTFVSSANAYVLRGAKIVFADSSMENPNIDTKNLQSLINKRTKAIVVVHYAGIANDMDKIIKIAEEHNLFVVEDAAQSIDSFFEKKPLGSIGHFGTFSFHETKNIISGEGGMLVINDNSFKKRAEIIWEKGTNRAAFFRGELDKYGWVDIGSSFLPSEIVAAFLYAQLEELDSIQSKRKLLWDYYYENFQPLEQMGICLPSIPEFATNNSHMFYLVCNNLDQRSELISHLKNRNILSVFHYQSLHKSPYYADKHDDRELPNADRYTDCLVRLPLYYSLTIEEQKIIIDEVLKYFLQN